MNALRSGLTLRLVLSHVGVATLVAIVLSVFLFQDIQQRWLNSLTRTLLDQARITADVVATSIETDKPEAVRTYLQALNNAVTVRVLVIDRTGHLLGATEPEEQGLTGAQLSADGLDQALTGARSEGISTTAGDLVYAAVPIEFQGQVIGAVRTSYGVSELADAFQSLRTGIAIGLLLAAGLGAAAALLLGYRLGQPAKRLALVAAAIAQGDLTQRIEAPGNDEIGQAAKAFDAMVDQLAAEQTERSELLAAASHDIHTSVSGVRLTVDLLEDIESLRPASRALLLRGLKAHCIRLQRLADDLLEAGRMGTGHARLELSDFSALAVLEHVVASLEAEAQEKAVTLRLDPNQADSALRSDFTRLAQALVDLTENGIRHTPRGGAVRLSSSVRDGICRLSVLDGGPGFPNIPQGVVTRLDVRPRRFASGRLGLGLNIAIGIAGAHGGWLEVLSNPVEGSQVSLALPVDKTRAPDDVVASRTAQ